MFLAIVDGWLEPLKCCLVNPLQALALILGNTRASHQKPACGKLRLGIATISGKFVPKTHSSKFFSTPSPFQ